MRIPHATPLPGSPDESAAIDAIHSIMRLAVDSLEPPPAGRDQEQQQALLAWFLAG